MPLLDIDHLDYSVSLLRRTRASPSYNVLCSGLLVPEHCGYGWQLVFGLARLILCGQKVLADS